MDKINMVGDGKIKSVLDLTSKAALCWGAANLTLGGAQFRQVRNLVNAVRMASGKSNGTSDLLTHGPRPFHGSMVIHA